MAYCDHSRYQTYCRYCFRQFEADSLEEVLATKVESHERKREGGKCSKEQE